MKTAVIGAGAIGCLFGGLLSQQNEVVFITRTDEEAQAINKDGIEITDAEGKKTAYENVKAYVGGTYDEPVDLLIFIVKTTQSVEALEANKALVQRAGLVMSLQNGGGNDKLLEEYVSPDKILLGLTRSNCINLGNGKIQRKNDKETLIGSPWGNTDAAEAVKELLVATGHEALVTEDITREVWRKLFMNISCNPFSAITKMPIGAMTATDHAWANMELLICEAMDVAKAEGIEFDRKEVLDSLYYYCSHNGENYPSMYQDVINQRKTEIDVINGYIVKEAEKMNMAAPYNKFVVNMIHTLEDGYEEA